VRQSKSLLFVNKKKQKNFVNWSALAASAHHFNKSFLLLFSKKDASLLHYNLLISRLS